MIWQSEIIGDSESDIVLSDVGGALPFTMYVCKVASFNTYGVGFSGSRDFVTNSGVG